MSELRERLRAVGWPESRAAEIAGVSPGHLSRCFGGERRLSRKAEARLREALNQAEQEQARERRELALANEARRFRSTVDEILRGGAA